MGNHDVWEDERFEEERREIERKKKETELIIEAVRLWLTSWNRPSELRLRRSGGQIDIVEERLVLNVKDVR